MAPSSCTELSASEREQLLEVARSALHHGLESTSPLQPALENASPALCTKRAVFVTLTRQGKLRGCIGALQASEPLLWAVADSAHGAGFRDPRFPSLQGDEIDSTSIEISVLSPMEPLPAASRGELCAALRPEQDGLLLQEGKHRATFLPQVWEKLPDKDTFLDHLLIKAGLPVEHWSTDLQFFRYRTISFSESSADQK
jgi:AmmeMemoRadiSam system protein A